MGADLQEEGGAFSGFWFVGEDADGAVGLEAMDDARARTDSHPQTFVADGHAAIGADLELSAAAPDVGPPGAARHRAQDAALVAVGGAGGGVGRALEFAMDFVGVAVAAQVGQEPVGGFGGGDGFGGEEGRQAALPVLMLAFDFALGLRRACVAQGDAVEVEGGSELGQRVGALRKEEAVAIDIKFQRQTVFGEGGGEEVEVCEQIFAVINGGSGADAGAIIQQIQEGIVFRVARKPAVGRGIELPERADFEALPAAPRGGWARGREGVSELMSEGPAAHGGRIDLDAQAAEDFGGSTAVGRGRLGREQFAQERFGAVGPVRSVVAAGGSRRPARRVRSSRGAQIVAVEFVEACATQTELIRGDGGGDLVAAEGGEEFADQGRTETMRELTIMFFKAEGCGLRDELASTAPWVL